MIIVTLYLKKFDWLVYVYIAVDAYYAQEIVDKLAAIGATELQQEEAMTRMSQSNLEGGIVYTNGDRRESVLVTEMASSPKEFMSVYVHCICNLVTHIATVSDMDLKGEDVVSMEGEIAMLLYPKCKRLFSCN